MKKENKLLNIISIPYSSCVWTGDDDEEEDDDDGDDGFDDDPSLSGGIVEKSDGF